MEKVAEVAEWFYPLIDAVVENKEFDKEFVEAAATGMEDSAIVSLAEPYVDKELEAVAEKALETAIPYSELVEAALRTAGRFKREDPKKPSKPPSPAPSP